MARDSEPSPARPAPRALGADLALVPELGQDQAYRRGADTGQGPLDITPAELPWRLLEHVIAGPLLLADINSLIQALISLIVRWLDESEAGRAVLSWPSAHAADRDTLMP